MKLLVDMNLSPRWAEQLAETGIAAVHWSALGSPFLPLFKHNFPNAVVAAVCHLEVAFRVCLKHSACA